MGWGWGCLPTSSRAELSPNSPDVEKASPSGLCPPDPSGRSGSPSPGVTRHSSLLFSPGILPSLTTPPALLTWGPPQLLVLLEGPRAFSPRGPPVPEPRFPSPRRPPTQHTPSPPPRLAPPPSPHSTRAPPSYLTASAARPQPSSYRRKPAGMPAVPSPFSPLHHPALPRPHHALRAC